jgi:hypothetical protein
LNAVASVVRTSITVVAINGRMLTPGLSGTPIFSTSVRVVTRRDRMDASRYGVTSIVRTKVIIVTRDLVIQTTQNVIAGVVRTCIVITATKRFNHATNGRITRGYGTSVGGCTLYGCVYAHTVVTRVSGTIVSITAIHWGKGTSVGRITRIGRTCVVVVAYGGCVDARSGRARVDRTWVFVVAVDLNVRATTGGGTATAHGVGGTSITVVAVEDRAVVGQSSTDGNRSTATRLILRKRDGGRTGGGPRRAVENKVDTDDHFAVFC